MSVKLGSMIRRLRLKSGIGLRRFAEIIEMPPSNWAAIEAGRRGVPSERLRDVADSLGLSEGSPEWEKFFNAAAEPGEFPADVGHLAKRKLIPALLRTIDNENLSDEQIGRLIAEIQGGVVQP